MSKRYGVRLREGKAEVVWMETVHKGWWRGMRLPDGLRTRGPVAALLGRFETESEANGFVLQKEECPHEDSQATALGTTSAVVYRCNKCGEEEERDRS